MSSKRKQQIYALLKGIETGDPDSVTVVDEAKYIQHNPQTEEGNEGLAELFKRLSKTSPRVNIVRIFEDGDFVFGHTEYDFSKRNIGFEVFRFEGDKAVEHWDNIQRRRGPNSSGHSMVDGAVEITDLEQTESNRVLIRNFIETVLIDRNTQKLQDYIDPQNYTEHSPEFSDDISELKQTLVCGDSDDSSGIRYQTLHRLLAEGNFVLSVCEGFNNQNHTSFYDLYRLNNNKIVEHWSTTESVPPVSEWKNNNGKF